MLSRKLEELGGELHGSRAADPEKEVEALEKRLGTRLPSTYRRMLIEYGGDIFLSNGALFYTEEPSPWAGENGEEAMELDGFYGVGQHHTTLSGMIDSLSGVDQMLPDGVIPIGDSPFGNQICLAIAGDDNGAIYFWDHEYEEGTGLYRAAPSFDAFLEMLEPDPEAHIPIEDLKKMRES